MAKRRTKQEKIVARLRRELEVKHEKPKIAEVKANVVTHDESLPRVELKADLTRTAIVAILALLLQAGMFYLLNYRGGWQIISKVWERG